MTISVQNSSDDSHLAASIEPAITVSMVGTNSKAIISVQNSSDDSHLAASIEPATTASMVGTNSKAVMCMSDVQTSSRSHIGLGACTWGLVRGGSAHFAAFVQEYSLEQYSGRIPCSWDRYSWPGGRVSKQRPYSVREFRQHASKRAKTDSRCKGIGPLAETNSSF